MSSLDDKAIAHRLEFLRESKGLSQQSFAQMLGCLQSTYSNWVRGKDRIPPHYAARVAQICGVSLDFIYTGNLSLLPANLVTLFAAWGSSPDAPLSESDDAE